MKRKLLILILVVITCMACIFSVTACDGDKPDNSGDGQGTIQTPPEQKPEEKPNEKPEEKPSVIEVTSVTLNKTTLALEVDDVETLTATVLPNNATDKTITWKSSDSSVAKVENGKITALKAGTATITATAGSKSATCKVTVTEKVIAVTSVTLNKTTLALEVDDVETLTVTVLPNNATDKTVTWGSSDSSVVKVENGKITALKAGTATITATAGSKSATCKVTVSEKIIPHTHELTQVPAKEADCEEAGNTAYYTCACGKWFVDANAKTEITDETTVTLEATGHSYSSEWTSDESQHWHVATCKHTSLTKNKEDHTFENGVCKVCGYINDLVVFKTLEVTDDTVYGKVSNATEDFSFIKEVTANINVTYTVCTDKACKDIIPSKTVDLKVGDNVFYVLAERSNEVKLYTVTLRRRPIYTVKFTNNGGFNIQSQNFEEDTVLTEFDMPEKTAKAGYTPSDWKMGSEIVSFPITITENITLTYDYIANNYNITFELEDGDFIEIDTVQVTYGEQMGLPVPKNESSKLSTFTGWYYEDTKITDNKGIMTSKWTIDKDVSLTARWKSIFIVSNGKVTGLTSEGKQFTEIVIPSVINGVKITLIGENAFKDCSSLTSVTIPESVTSIGSSAFKGCSSLESITLPFVGFDVEQGNSVYHYPFGYIFGTSSYTGGTAVTQTYIYVGEMYGGYGSRQEKDTYYIPKTLKSVKITGSDIRFKAFENCGGLTSVTIADSVTTIGGSAFEGCRKLTEINYGGTIAQWNSIYKNSYWNMNTGNYTIHCTDGDIAKS